VPVLAYGAVTLAARNGIVPGFDPGSTTVPSGDSSSAAPGDGSGVGASTPAAAPTAAPTTSTPAVALGTQITVTNVAGISGIAAAAETKLKAAGFTALTTGNGSKGTLTASTVFYATEALKPTAAKVASTLGLTAVTQSTTKSGGSITVMLVAKLP
jgi:dihydroorotate dehydrogenase